jgi:hypothetical protein
MSWILEHLQILIGVAAAIAYFINRRKHSEAETETPPPRSASNAGESSYEQAERTRRVQDEIRRKIAERRGAVPGVPVNPASKSRIPDLVPPPRVPPLDPFGGPMRRILRKIEEAAEQATPAPSAQESAAATNELARQRMLEERMREMEATKLVRENQLRTQVALLAKKRSGLNEPSASLPIGRLSRALRSPQELRRAIVLREVLGPPVSLR